MKNFMQKLLVFGVLYVGLSVTPSFAQNNVTVLENGLRVLVVEDDRFPLVTVQLFVYAGGMTETPDKAGISHLLEHMVFRGTTKRADGRSTKEIEEVGGNFNAYTSSDRTVYYADLPAKEWRRGIDVIADMALNATIEPNILEEEKKVVFAEMGQRREDPYVRLYENTLAKAFEGTSYAHWVLGTEKTVGAITSKDMHDYMDKLYTPQNMILVVVGDIKKDEVIAEAKKHFAGSKNTEQLKAPSIISLPLFTETKVSITPSTSNKVLMNISFPIPSSRDLQNNTFKVLQIVLGGLDTSILKQKFERDTKLVNTISSHNDDFYGVGLFSIAVDVEVDKVDAFWTEFIKFLAGLSTKDFTQAQLDTAKFLYENSFQRKKGTLSGYASLLGNNEFTTPGELSIQNFLYSIKQVTMKNLEDVLKAWITPSNMVVAVLAPEKAIAAKQLPNFVSVVQENWKNADNSMNIIADTVNYKSLLPKGAKILEESEKRIVIEYAKGSKVILLPDKTMPFLRAGLTLVGGDSLLSPKEQGLSSALAAMSAVATESMNRDELSAYTAQRAISISAVNSRETFTMTLDAPTQFEKEAFKLFGETIHKPVFAAKDWENIHNLLVVNALEREEEPDDLIFSELLPTLYTTKNAYGYVSNGKASTIEKFTLEQVQKLWEKQKNQGWIFTIAGDFRMDKALQFVQTLALNTKPITPLSAPTMQSSKEKTFVLPKKNHEYIMQIFPTVPYEDKDAVALSVLDSLLGDMSGILFQEVREKRSLAYYAGPIDFSSSKTGFLSFYVNTGLENNGKILPVFKEIIDDLNKHPLPQANIDSAVVSMELKYARAQQKLSTRVSAATTNMYLGRSLDYQEEFFKKARQVSPQDIQRVTEKYLKPEKAYLLKVTSN